MDLRNESIYSKFHSELVVESRFRHKPDSKSHDLSTAVYLEQRDSEKSPEGL